MAWSLGGVTIHPGDKEYIREKTANYAIQQVLDATSEVVSWFGANSSRRNLNFTILGDEAPTGVTILEGLVDTNADVALVSDAGAEGNYRILSLRSVRVQDISRGAGVTSWACAASLIKV